MHAPLMANVRSTPGCGEGADWHSNMGWWPSVPLKGTLLPQVGYLKLQQTLDPVPIAKEQFTLLNAETLPRPSAGQSSLKLCAPWPGNTENLGYHLVAE